MASSSVATSGVPSSSAVSIASSSLSRILGFSAGSASEMTSIRHIKASFVAAAMADALSIWLRKALRLISSGTGWTSLMGILPAEITDLPVDESSANGFDQFAAPAESLSTGTGHFPKASIVTLRLGAFSSHSGQQPPSSSAGTGGRSTSSRIARHQFADAAGASAPRSFS